MSSGDEDDLRAFHRGRSQTGDDPDIVRADTIHLITGYGQLLSVFSSVSLCRAGVERPLLFI